MRSEKRSRGRRGEAEGPSTKDNRKAKQLCRQVEQTLNYVLSGECDDELLRCLQVVSVVPAPNASRLLVTVTVEVGEHEFDHVAIAERLSGQMGRLRADIAVSISRKRVPLLAFQIVAPQQQLKLADTIDDDARPT